MDIVRLLLKKNYMVYALLLVMIIVALVFLVARIVIMNVVKNVRSVYIMI